MRRFTSRVSSLGVAIVACVAIRGASAAQTDGPPAAGAERFRATAIDLGGLRVGGNVAPSGSVAVTLQIQRFSTETERSELLATLETTDGGELAESLAKMPPVGQIQIQGRLAYDLKYAREIADESGQRQLILATDRPIPLFEVRNQTRSRDFGSSVVEPIVDAEGCGSGTAIPAAQVRFDRDSGDLELITLSSTPVQLVNVRPAR